MSGIGDFTIDLTTIDSHTLSNFSNEKFRYVLENILTLQQADRKENQLLYYKPASDEAGQIHYSKAKWVGISGGNGCLALDSPVLMADGKWKNLGDIEVGDKVIGADPETGKAKPCNVTKLWRSGLKQLYKVTFSYGGSFEATAEHKVPIKSVNNRESTDVSKVEVGVIRKQLNCEGPNPANIKILILDNGWRNVSKIEKTDVKECGDIEVDHPSHCYITKDYVIVSNSSKTETFLVHFIALATGIFPQGLEETFKEQFRGPINCRIVVESFTTVLETIILPKLKWWVWTGVDNQGGDRGHWGWIPKTCLIDGSWERSYSQKLKVLTLICRNPDNTDERIGESQIQFMSKDQDPSDFASGDFHLILHDEPPFYAQWRENQARTMRVNGRIFLSFTWPDDPSIPCDWIHDEIYEKSQEPNKSEYHDWFELDTTKNMNLDQDAIRIQAEQWDSTTRAVRLYGKSMSFSSRIHPLFTDQDTVWCMHCKKNIYVDADHCPECFGKDYVTYNHVVESENNMLMPSVFLLDPHPRKPHMWLWVSVDANDDLYCFAEGELASEPMEVAAEVSKTEEEFKMYVALRLIDPNMGRSPASINREITWQDEFDHAGLLCELADDSGVGRRRVDEFLKPDPYTARPRLLIHPRCQMTIHQMKRYRWEDYKTSLEKDIKQVPRAKDDDYPTLLKYLLNYQPTFQMLKAGAPVLKRQGTRKGAY